MCSLCILTLLIVTLMPWLETSTNTVEGFQIVSRHFFSFFASEYFSPIFELAIGQMVTFVWQMIF